VDCEPARSPTPTFGDSALRDRAEAVTDAEVRRRLPADLPQLLRLEEWNQPDLFEMPPSQSETYQLIAVVLESLAPTRYRPTLAPNTHWSNWPDSGSL
jgi:hypothetical protein